LAVLAWINFSAKDVCLSLILILFWTEKSFSYVPVLERPAVSIFRVEIFVLIYQTTWHYMPEDHNFNIHHSKNLGSHILHLLDVEQFENVCKISVCTSNEKWLGMYTKHLHYRLKVSLCLPSCPDLLLLYINVRSWNGSFVVLTDCRLDVWGLIPSACSFFSSP
jgi:hypothetical protein